MPQPQPTAALGATLLALLTACSPAGAPSGRGTPGPRTAAELAQGVVDAMGGRAALEGIETIVRKGSGTRTRMGQIPETGGVDPTGELEGVTETIDLANGRAAFDYDIVNGGFMQHRTEVFTSFEGKPVGWATGPGRPDIVTSPNGIFSWATQNSPELLLRRNVITVALAAAATAAATEPVERREFGGKTTLYASAELPSGEAVDLYVDPTTSLLDGFVTLDTETMLGDVEARYILSNYRADRGLVLPYSVRIVKQGRPYASIDYSSISINDPAALEIFAIPDDAIDQAREAVATDGSWAPLAWNEVAPKVYHAVGYSHNSLVVEFPTFVFVVEAPYTEAQSLTLARRIGEEIGKPIRYVAPTHPHYDHTGGIRALAALGATVLVAAGHEAELRGIVEAPHTNPPDELARREAAGEDVGEIEVFSGMKRIEEGDQSVELYEVDTIPHVKPKVLAYVPSTRVLFQSDLFFGGPSPDATALYEAVRARNLRVETIVGGHGATWPYSQLEGAVNDDPQ